MGTRRPRIPKASDIVVSAVRERIIVHRLAEGTALPTETEMMAEYGVGRVTVREALRLLEHDGLIEVRRGVHGGVFVRHPQVRQVSDVVSLVFAMRNTTLREFAEYRQLVEPAAAELAARNISEEQRTALRGLVEQESGLGQVQDLHQLVAEATGNGVLGTALNALHHPFQEHFRPGKIHASHLAETAASHRKIAERILAGDGAAARRAMAVHLEAYRAYLEREDLLEEPIIPREVWRVPG
ncbi:FadR/GntR family transcriptional regulator [Nocardioides sp. zg-1228]|uniref:FadR/GntR family transcriptional regulator n=1 Tax=Nocardioides sp. zg-1228 TaxID=2763008 RepID=UPI0016428213|nr:GntR family transcriptional regulator [Nocardioides sp. zg-1228]MBC2932089.1 FadR family transcriptional regulator [Nocardioides sp. zg-1228]QSF57637.1 FadR family transcriptional regulator [Nocardioides sp. zg-1228]